MVKFKIDQFNPFDMKTRAEFKTLKLDTDRPVWDQFFMVAPLVVIGTKEGDKYDLAPKHMVTPLGFDNYFGFVCTPDHNTYANVRSSKEFTVSFPMPDQVVLSSLTASPRCDSIDRNKDIMDSIPYIKAPGMDAPILENCYLFMECDLYRVIDGFNTNSLICGKIRSAHVHENYSIQSERDIRDQIYDNPLLAYIAYGRYAEIKETYAFPFPKDFKR